MSVKIIISKGCQFNSMQLSWLTSILSIEAQTFDFPMHQYKKPTLTSDLKIKLAEQNHSSNQRICQLASQAELPLATTREFVAQYGLKTTSLAARIARECRIPIRLCFALSGDPVLYRATVAHEKLLAVLREIDEEAEFALGNLYVRASIEEITAGTNMAASKQKATVMSFADLFAAVYPTEDDLAEHPELAGLNDMVPSQHRSEYLNGSLGYLTTSVPVCVESPPDCSIQAGDPFLLVTNGQDRRAFYKLPDRMQRGYRKWYQRVITMHHEAAQKVGITNLAISSSQLVATGIKTIYNHVVPPSVLDRYYDRYAEKRGYQKHQVTFRHPVNDFTLQGDIWVA